MSSKRSHRNGSGITVNRSGQHGLVIKSEKLSLPWADRFVIVDEADESMVLDDCCGYGYQTKNQAIRVWEKSGDYIKQQPTHDTWQDARGQSGNLHAEDRQRRAAHWLKVNYKLSNEIADLIDFSAKSRLAVRAEDIQEILMQNDFVADLSFAADLLEAVSAQIDSGNRQHKRSVTETMRCSHVQA